MIVPKADERHSWISRGAGLASVSNVLCLPAMLCQCIFRVGGGTPLPGPRRVGGFLQGSRERLRVFLSWVVQPRGRGKAVELAGRAKAHGKLPGFFQGGSFERLERGRERGRHREGVAGVGQSWLEGDQSCLGKEETRWKRVIPGQHGSRRQGQGQASTGDERQTQTTPFSRSSGCDFCSRHANPEGPPSPPSFSPAGRGLAWPPNEMQSCSGEQGGKKRLCLRFCASGFLWPSLPAG